MGETYHYFSLQYSAIQKTVLRHDRLWSIAGMSQILSRLNEIELPAIVGDKEIGGTVLVAGGGKFTAKFTDDGKAKAAKTRILHTVSTTLPMLEFQASDIVPAGSLKEAKEKGLIDGLNEKKRRFRGYGVTYNPHVAVCTECGEYPAAASWSHGEEKSALCRACYQARDARLDLKDVLEKQKNEKPLTSIERVYADYFKADKTIENPSLPDDFEKLFPKARKGKGTNANDTGEERNRMAVWFSDANNMNAKVPVWLSQEDDDLPKIFKKVKDVNIEVISGTLKAVFGSDSWNDHDGKKYLPFRLVVAGGDDLCLVMPEKYILEFTLAFSRQVSAAIGQLDEKHCLHQRWLEAKRDKAKQSALPGPYCFGASFVVTPIHTPFKAIHTLGESLMSKAKKDTNREADSINWQILNVDEEAAEGALLKFEKPLFIQKANAKDTGKRAEIQDKLAFEDYLALRIQFKNISGSQMKNIAAALIDAKGDSGKAEMALIKSATAAREKGLTELLTEQPLRKNSGHGSTQLDLPKVATLLELMTLKRMEENA